jgi:hypothetical protein
MSSWIIRLDELIQMELDATIQLFHFKVQTPGLHQVSPGDFEVIRVEGP